MEVTPDIMYVNRK